MTLDEKLTSFYELAIADANRQSETMLEEYKNSLEEMLTEHEEAMTRKMASLLEIESQKMVQEKNQKMAGETLEFRRKLTEKTEELKKLLFADVEKQLSAYMKSDDYVCCLEKQIRDALVFARGDAITIYINASDEKLKEDLERATGARLTVSTIDFVGGTRAVIAERNILIDRSFLTKISEEKDSFTL